ncbi:MAG: hypothetical protein LBB11_02915 [Puniceicoccales bacterium]|jgi:uncharacterized membrane protein YphA (DoxX/SURF4 family)|nr:hypothetical protein [Puniceicoccales bacterium]
MKAIAYFLEKENFGKLLIRFFWGLFFIILGIRYFAGGMATLKTLGSIFNNIGIHSAIGFWGIITALVLILSGICFFIGFFFRTNCCVLLFIFFLKVLTYRHTLQSFFDEAYLLDVSMALLLFSFLFIGAGRFSFDRN